MNDLIKYDKELVWHPFTQQGEATPESILVTSASGIYLHTHDGRKIIDAISSWWVNLHGHAHPKLAEALYQQALTLEHVIFAGFTHPPAIELAKNLLSLCSSQFTKVFFSDNGSTANEVALKMAIQYWHNKGIKKKKIIALEGAYHGDTFGAMSVGGRNLFSDPFAEYLFDVSFIDLPSNNNKEIILQQFTTLVQTGEVGIFIFEPLIQGAAGMRMYPAEILEQLVKIAKTHNVICIADEVFTGFGRTGKFLATDYLSTKPDIIAVSKGITGGALPLGATICTKEIYNAFQTDDIAKSFLHGHSYTGNPLTCAVANASFEIFVTELCQNQIRMITDNHKKFSNRIRNNSQIENISALGTILSIELKTNQKPGYSNSLRKIIYDFFLDRNILLRPLGNVIYIVPPYVIKEDELNKIYSCIEEFLSLLNNR